MLCSGESRSEVRSWDRVPYRISAVFPYGNRRDDQRPAPGFSRAVDFDNGGGARPRGSARWAGRPALTPAAVHRIPRSPGGWAHKRAFEPPPFLSTSFCADIRARALPAVLCDFLLAWFSQNSPGGHDGFFGFAFKRSTTRLNFVSSYPTEERAWLPKKA
jgi:hypothetical protein